MDFGVLVQMVRLTRLEAMRKLITAQRDHIDQGRIGRRQIFEKPDGRETLIYAIKVLNSAFRRAA